MEILFLFSICYKFPIHHLNFFVDSPVLKGDYIPYTPEALNFTKTEKAQTNDGILTEDSAISSKDGHTESEVSVTHKAGALDENSFDKFVPSVVLDPLAPFGEKKKTTSSSNEIDNINFAHIARLM